MYFFYCLLSTAVFFLLSLLLLFAAVVASAVSVASVHMNIPAYLLAVFHVFAFFSPPFFRLFSSPFSCQTGVFRSDLPEKFRLVPSALQALIDNVDRDLTFAIEVESGVQRDTVSNYDEVRKVPKEARLARS